MWAGKESRKPEKPAPGGLAAVVGTGSCCSPSYLASLPIFSSECQHLRSLSGPLSPHSLVSPCHHLPASRDPLGLQGVGHLFFFLLIKRVEGHRCGFQPCSLLAVSVGRHTFQNRFVPLTSKDGQLSSAGSGFARGAEAQALLWL